MQESRKEKGKGKKGLLLKEASEKFLSHDNFPYILLVRI